MIKLYHTEHNQGNEIDYLPHPLNPPLHNRDIYSLHEGEVFLKGWRLFKLPLMNAMDGKGLQAVVE